MAGRWRMASVHITAVYWFAGESIAGGGNAISIGTLVAFTTLQTRMLFPIQSLLSVGLEVQTSLALFGRIFEYLDLPVDIVERPGARSLTDVRGETCPWTTSGSATPPTRHGRLKRSALTFSRRYPVLLGETGSGKTTLAYWWRGCMSPSAAA